MSADLFRDFSEAQWREIAESLMDSGVDLDALKGGEFVPGTQWWLPPDFPPNARSVRHGLKAAAFHYGLRARTDPFSKELPTPVKQTDGLQKQLEAIEHAIDTIYRTETAYPKAAFEVGREVPKELLAHIPPKPILAALWQYRDELRDQIAALRAAGTRRDQNARTIHNDYWRELARLWVGITGSAGSKRRQQLRRFLLACTPLTLFPDITEQELPQKLDSFVASFFR